MGDSCRLLLAAWSDFDRWLKGGSDLFLRTLIRPRCGAALVPAERALTDSSRRRRARRRLRGRCTRGRHWPICAVPGRSSGRGRTSFGWGYCAPTVTGLFARTFNLPNIICAMCDRSRNLARLAAACVCRQIFGGCRVTNRCCGGRRAGWSRVCCPRCVGLLVKKSSSTASTAAGAWASTAGAAVSTGGEKAFRRLFFFFLSIRGTRGNAHSLSVVGVVADGAWPRVPPLVGQDRDRA